MIMELDVRPKKKRSTNTWNPAYTRTHSLPHAYQLPRQLFARSSPETSVFHSAYNQANKQYSNHTPAAYC